MTDGPYDTSRGVAGGSPTGAGAKSVAGRTTAPVAPTPDTRKTMKQKNEVH